MSLKQKTINGTIWTFAEQFSVKGINFIIQLLLARILAPAQFALIAMMTIVISIGTALVEGGLSHSLIRTKNANKRDYSTVFFMNVFVSFVIYIIIYYTSTYIAKFYEQPILEDMVKVFSLIIPIKALMTVQETLLIIDMNFRKQVFIQAPSILISGCLALYLAQNNYGAWALVYMQVFQAVLMTIQYWVFSNWKPSLIFDVKTFKQHFHFGYKLTLNTFLNSFFGEIYNIIIGKYYSATTLGLYNRAYAFQHLPGYIFDRALSKVTYPLFSKIQDDNLKLKNSYKSITLIAMMLFTPIMIFFYFMAKPFILVMLGHQWIGAIEFLKLLAIGGLSFPIQAYNWNLLKVKGRSDLVLKVNTFVKIVTIIGLFIVTPLGIKPLIYFQIFTSYFSLVMLAHYSGKFINYNVKEQFIDLVPIILFSMLSGFISNLIINNLIENNIFKIILYLLTFSIIYFPLLYFIKFKPLIQFVELIEKKRKIS